MLVDCILDLITNLPISYMVMVAVDSVASTWPGFFYSVLLSESSFYIHIGRWIR